MHGFSRKRVAMAFSIILVLIALEFYAYTYVHVDRLPLLTQEEALKFPFYVNGTYTFSSNGARWFLVLQYQKPEPSLNFAYVYIFKIEQNVSFLTRSVDLLVSGLDLKSNGTAGFFMASVDETFYEGNFTVVRIWYDIGQIGVYEVDFGLRVRVYEDTFLGLLPRGDVRVPINATLYYGPP